MTAWRLLGRQRAVERPEVRRAWPEVRAAVTAGTLSLRAAARRLGVGTAAGRRMLAEAVGCAEKGSPAEAPEAVSCRRPGTVRKRGPFGAVSVGSPSALAGMLAWSPSPCAQGA